MICVGGESLPRNGISKEQIVGQIYYPSENDKPVGKGTTTAHFVLLSEHFDMMK